MSVSARLRAVREAVCPSFVEYQSRARAFALYPPQKIGQVPVYPVLGLTGEAGEVAEKFKKIIRDQDGLVTNADREAIAKELGDVLWYISNICSELEIRLDEVAAGNLTKLADRAKRNKLGGSGDDR